MLDRMEEKVFMISKSIPFINPTRNTRFFHHSTIKKVLFESLNINETAIMITQTEYLNNHVDYLKTVISK